MGFLNKKEVGGWDDQYQCLIEGKATERWTLVPFEDNENGLMQLWQLESIMVFKILCHEPWPQKGLVTPVEIVCGLSEDRKF